MKIPLNGPPPAEGQPASGASRSAGSSATGSPDVQARPTVDGALSTRAQLDQLGLKPGEVILARVAALLQDKDGMSQATLQLRGGALQVALPENLAAVNKGDLLKIARAGNELQLMSVLDLNPGPRLSQSLAQHLPWQQRLETVLQQLQQTLSTGLAKSLTQSLATLRQGPNAATAAGAAAPAGAPGTADLPPGVRNAVENLLSSLPRQNQLRLPDGPTRSDALEGNARQVERWIKESGLFTESRMLAARSAELPDLKLAVARVVSQLLAVQGESPASLSRYTPPADSLLTQSPLTFPLAEMGSSPPAKEPLPPGQMLRLLAGLMNRITVNQLHSQVLSTTTAPDAPPPPTTLLLELPWLTDQNQLKVAQLRVEREDEQSSDGDTSRKAAVREWRFSLALDLEDAGPLFFEIRLRQQQLTGQIWAEKETTFASVDEELGSLRKRLTDLGLEIGELECRRGQPPRRTTQLEHRLVDTKA